MTYNDLIAVNWRTNSFSKSEGYIKRFSFVTLFFISLTNSQLNLNDILGWWKPEGILIAMYFILVIKILLYHIYIFVPILMNLFDIHYSLILLDHYIMYSYLFTVLSLT